MAEADDKPAAADDPFDKVDIAAVLAHATEPNGEHGSRLGAAVVALAARCLAVVDGAQPPPARDVLRDWQHPAVAVLLLADRFVRVLADEDATGEAAAAAHLGLCLLLMYVESSDEARRMWTAVTDQDELPWAVRIQRRLQEFGIGDAQGTVEPPHAPIVEFLRDYVEAASADYRAPRRLRDMARQLFVGAQGPTDAGALDEYDAAIQEVERGKLVYPVDPKPKPNTFYVHAVGGRERLFYGSVAPTYIDSDRTVRPIHLGTRHGNLFAKLALDRRPTDKERRARAELQRALAGAGSTVKIEGRKHDIRFDRKLALDGQLHRRLKEICRRR